MHTWLSVVPVLTQPTAAVNIIAITVNKTAQQHDLDATEADCTCWLTAVNVKSNQTATEPLHYKTYSRPPTTEMAAGESLTTIVPLGRFFNNLAPGLYRLSLVIGAGAEKRPNSVVTSTDALLYVAAKP
ncbi:MAG TPA: hypothetical protein VMG98_14165 [Verrucomicrobiae bacterium]|nr:hypothetical protein [Verrucomicrobiae bacterium]